MSQFQAWIRGLPQSIPPRVENFPLSNINVAKGEVVNTDTAGDMVVATVANSPKKQHFVTIEAVDNSGGSAGDLHVAVVGQGQQVTVQTKSILSPGDPVKIAATDGMVALFDVALDDDNLRIGHYVGKEPGTYLKDSATPFAESYENDFTSLDCAVDDIVIIELGT
jgi:hypothetical protein